MILLKYCLFTLLISAMVLAPGAGAAATGADSFNNGVSAFKERRYQDALREFSAFLRKQPSTPLRDMALYYIARSYLKIGNEEKAAETAARLLKEFPASFNKGTLEPELFKLASGKSHRPAATGGKATAPAPPAKGRKGNQKSHDAVPEFEVSIPTDLQKIQAGHRASIPFSVTNRGKLPDRYRLLLESPPAFAASVEGVPRPAANEAAVTPTIAPGATFKGSISVAMPPEAVDGSRYSFPIRAISASSRHNSISRDVTVAASAPHLRMDVKRRETLDGRQLVAYKAAVPKPDSVATAEDITARLLCARLKAPSLAGLHDCGEPEQQEKSQSLAGESRVANGADPVMPN